MNSRIACIFRRLTLNVSLLANRGGVAYDGNIVGPINDVQGRGKSFKVGGANWPRGVERESPSAVEMDPTSAHFDDTFRECLLAKIGPLICCHFVLLLRVVCVCAQKIGSV